MSIFAHFSQNIMSALKKSLYTIGMALTAVILMPTFVFATTIGGQPADHPFDDDPDYHYNCQFIESASLYRPCKRRYGDDGFDVRPAVGSFTKKNGAITDIDDVKDLNEYRIAVEFTASEGYFDLFRNRRFSPNRTVSREEFISVLIDVLGVDVPANTPTDCFADVHLVERTNSKATQEMNKKKICYAKSKGWVGGSSPFYPQEYINKAAAAKIIMSAYNFPSGYTNLGDNYFDDVERGTWYARYVNAGRQYNIFPDRRRFEPGGKLTRQEASLWFYNLRRQQRIPATPGDAAIRDIKEYTETMLAQMINESRLKYGKVQLKYDPKLYQLALMHSQAMAQDSALVHGDLRAYRSYLGDTYMAIGENIAVFKISSNQDISKMVENTHKRMMNEPANEPNHRGNILGYTFSYTEFAIAVYEDKRDGRIWITQVFAKKRP